MKKKFNKRRFTIKLVLSSIYLMVITILLVCSYRLYTDKNKIVPWENVESVDDYSYIKISKMSEKFAYYENENIGLHFVIEEEDTWLWHTYVIAINEDKYNEFKDIIDFSYERTTKKPEEVIVYGYPIIMNEELKKMILNNIKNFLPADNEVEITKDNLEEYLTNSYLDTTKEKVDKFDYVLFFSLLLLFIMVAVLVFTLFDKDKMVDNLEVKAENIEINTKKLFKRKR